jgi:nitrile hydratase subunit beta
MDVFPVMQRYRGYHDLGGRPAGPVAREEHPFAEWQKLSEAIRGALDAKGRLVTLDEVRRAFESFGSQLYDTLGFYERRVEALAMLLDEKGLLSRTDIETRMNAIARAEGRTVDHAARAILPGPASPDTVVPSPPSP